ncbi:hypothetical protein ILYODFUR_030750 [Ilyodon furcidens]|uniref:MHC class I-like antigen recognition-like domain-containing protein n=1 Tax=Ilyodon furcidens TaxID=33524 RepID=A0ABV0UWR6_9TELE
MRQVMMKLFVSVVLCLGLQHVAAVMHSWKAFYTGSTGLGEFPEFVALNLLDDEVMGYFDSKTNRFESKQSWMTENLGQEYVNQQTNILQGNVPNFKANIEILKQRFNQTGGSSLSLFINLFLCCL